MMGEYDAGYEKCIDSMVRQMEDMQFCIDNLRRENSKLRELVKDMLDVMLDYRCDIRMPNSLDYSNEPAVFKERARELGVEVDG